MERKDLGYNEMERQDVSEEDIKYMKEAIKQAKKAGKLMEVPIGCVIVYEGKIIESAVSPYTVLITARRAKCFPPDDTFMRLIT